MSRPDTATVCAVVVTYNRLALLRECLAALREQTRPVDRVIVVDNASTDETPAVVARDFPEFELMRLEENTGGAGGFETGMRRAHEQGFDWFWLMDDDTIPTTEALGRLLGALDRLDGLPRPQIMCSRAFGLDGDLHPMNRPRPQMRDFTAYVEATSRGLMPIRYASFVSLLVRRDAVDQHGFPYGHYFIWGDDFEYSARILRRGSGYLVPDSVVHHKSKSANTSAAGPRYYYELRNKLLALRGGAFGAEDRVEVARQGMYVATGMLAFLREDGLNRESLRTVGRGLLHGLTDPPDRPPKVTRRA